jgi:thioesterase domain-containing protein
MTTVPALNPTELATHLRQTDLGHWPAGLTIDQLMAQAAATIEQLSDRVATLETNETDRVTVHFELHGRPTSNVPKMEHLERAEEWFNMVSTRDPADGWTPWVEKITTHVRTEIVFDSRTVGTEGP